MTNSNLLNYDLSKLNLYSVISFLMIVLSTIALVYSLFFAFQKLRTLNAPTAPVIPTSLVNQSAIEQAIETIQTQTINFEIDN